MRSRLVVLLVLLPLLLSGCSTWSYRPYTSWSGGYEERSLSPQIYEVRFQRRVVAMWEFFLTLGMSVVPFAIDDVSGRWDRQGHDMTLLRSAQLSLEQGYAYFAIDPVWSTTHRLVIRMFVERPDATVHDALAEQSTLRQRYRSRDIPVVVLSPESKSLDPCLSARWPRSREATSPGSAVACNEHEAEEEHGILR